MILKTVTVIFVFFLTFLLPGLLSFGIKFFPSGDQPSLDRTEKLYGDFIIRQKFTSSEGNLAAIGLSIKNPNLLNKQDINFNLIDQDLVVRLAKLNGANIGDGAFMKFRFDPIIDSKGKLYEFNLSAPDAKEESALEPFISLNKPRDVGKLQINGQEATGSSLSFVSFYKPEERLGFMVGIYSDWFGRFIKDTGFFIFYLVVITGLSGYLLLGLEKKN